MEHLVREFASENMLFIIEVKLLADLMNIQMKLLDGIHVPTKFEGETYLLKELKQAKSSNNENINLVFWKTLQSLYYKYISLNAKLCLNISYANRNRCINEFENNKTDISNKDLNKLFVELFEPCIKECEYLVRDGWSRFRQQTSIRQEIDEITSKLSPNSPTENSK